MKGSSRILICISWKQGWKEKEANFYSIIITNMNKQTGLIAGTTLLFVASIITFAGQFATSVVVARTLGPEFKGIYNLTLLSSGLVIIVSNLGLNGAISYFTASKKYSSQQLFFLAIVGGLVLSVIGGLLFFLAYDSILAKSLLAGSDRQLILWVMLGLPLSLVTSFLSSLLLGQQRMVAYNSVNILRVLTNLAFQIISSAMAGGVHGAVISWLSANGIALMLALWLLRRDSYLRTSQSTGLVPAALSYGGKSYAGNLLTFFNYRLDSFLVNFFRGTAAVGQYTTSVTMAELLWYLPNAVSGALFPKVSSVDEDIANRLTPQACRQTLLVVVIAAILFGLVGGWLLVGFYGEAYRPAIAPFLWLLPGMTGVTVAKIISADLSGRGKPQYAAYTAGVTVVLTVILDLLLIPRISISGAGIASSLSYLTSGALSVFWYCRETGALPEALLIPRRDDIRFLMDRSKKIVQRSLRFMMTRKGNN
jgi:O-antigen/teichoic acid export membrane protein